MILQEDQSSVNCKTTSLQAFKHLIEVKYDQIAQKRIYYILLWLCGYQYDKAVNKNDTREVIWYHFASEMISYHFTGLNCPIK